MFQPQTYCPSPVAYQHQGGKTKKRGATQVIGWLITYYILLPLQLSVISAKLANLWAPPAWGHSSQLPLLRSCSPWHSLATTSAGMVSQMVRWMYPPVNWHGYRLFRHPPWISMASMFTGVQIHGLISLETVRAVISWLGFCSAMIPVERHGQRNICFWK